MPRAGLAKEQLSKGGGLNFGKGPGEITDAVIINHQFPPNKQTGDQEELRPKIRLTLIRLDKNWKPTGEDAVEEYLPLAGKGGLAKFHPGNAGGPDDEEPEDLGDEQGAEGNCIYSEGDQINQLSKAGIFTASLEDAAFKPEYLNGYMPNLIGLQANFVTLKMKGGDGMKDWDAFQVDVSATPAIHKFPYQKGGAAGKSASLPGKPAGANAKTLAPAPPAKATAGKPVRAESNGSGEINPEVVAHATSILTAIGEAKSGETLTRLKEGPPASRLPTQIIKYLGNLKVPPALHSPVRNLLESDWLKEAGMELGWEVDENQVVVP